MVVLEPAAVLSPLLSNKKKKKATPAKTDAASPVKKQRLETGTPQPKSAEKSPKEKKQKKRSIQFNEDVKVREIENAVPSDTKKKSSKKEKTAKNEKTNKKKVKLVKKIGEKLAGKKTKKTGEKGEEKDKLSKKEEREKQKETKVARKKFKQQEDVFDIGVKAKKVWEEVRKLFDHNTSKQCCGAGSVIFCSITEMFSFLFFILYLSV